MKNMLKYLLLILTSAAARAGTIDWDLPEVVTLDGTTAMVLAVNGSSSTGSVKIAPMNLRTTGLGIPANPNSPGATLMVDGDNVAKWFDASHYIRLYDDFFGGSGNVETPTGFLNGSTGTGAIFSNNGSVDANHMGVWKVDTGTATNGIGVGSLATTSWVFGTGRMIAEWLMCIDTLSTDAEVYCLRVGFNDSVSGGDATDGAYFKYQHNINSGNWQCLTANNAAYFTNSTSVAATASTTGTAWHKFKIDIDAAASNAYFYIDGTSVATNSSQIPTTITRATCPSMVIQKLAGTTGTTARKALFDYFTLLWTATTPR